MAETVSGLSCSGAEVADSTEGSVEDKGERAEEPDAGKETPVSAIEKANNPHYS